MYLKITKDYMLTYKRSNQLEIIGYSYSYFSRCQDSKKFASGYIYVLDGGDISWYSAKQTLIASSTMTTTFIACFEVSKHEIWPRNLVTGI